MSGRLTSVPSVCPTVRCCWGVLRGRAPLGCTMALFGRGWPARVVVVYGQARRRSRNAHRPALRWEGVTPQLSCRSLPCAWLVRDSLCARAAVQRRGGSCGRARLRVLEVSHALHQGAAEGAHNFVRKGRVCCPGLRLSADGGLPSFAQRQRPDPVARGVRQHSRGHRLGRGPPAFSWPLCPAPRGSVTRERRVRWDDGSGCGAAPFPYCRRVTGVREVRPPPGGCGRRSLGFHSCLTSWAAKASLHSLGVRRTCRAGGRLPRWCARSTSVAGVCCAAAQCWVVRGGLFGRGLPTWGRCGSWLTPQPLA